MAGRKPGAAPLVQRVARGGALIAAKDGSELKPASAEAADRRMAWREGLLIFQGESLGAAATEFDRYNQRKIVIEGQALAHPFGLSAITNPPFSGPYWRDVGTIDAYWAANLDLASTTPALNMYDKDWPIWTYQEQLAPAKFVHDQDGRRGMAIDSLVSGGCIVSGSVIRNSVLFSSILVRSYSEINEAVVLPDVQINRHCRLRKVVIDRGCVLPEGLVIGEDPELDARRFHRTEGGVVLVTQQMLDALQE